jgi:hypothetical protein
MNNESGSLGGGGGEGVKNLIQFNRVLVENGYDFTLQRGKLYEDRWWKLNKIV